MLIISTFIIFIQGRFFFSECMGCQRWIIACQFKPAAWLDFHGFHLFSNAATKAKGLPHSSGDACHPTKCCIWRKICKQGKSRAEEEAVPELQTCYVIYNHGAVRNLMIKTDRLLRAFQPALETFVCRWWGREGIFLGGRHICPD